MKDNNEIRQYIEEQEAEDVLIFENPDYSAAFLGLSDTGRAVYDYERMVECLMTEDDMSEEDARDFISYNTLRSLGYYENSPIVLFPTGE